MLARAYHYIPNPEKASKWQQEMLEKIHIYNQEGKGSTLLFFDYQGGVQREHSRYGFAMPIQSFDPKHEKEAIGHLKALHERGEFICPDDAVEQSARRVLEHARKELADTRVEEYRYKLMPEEERQIARMFVELNKYPAVSEEMSKDPRHLVLVARGGHDIHSVSDVAGGTNARGYYEPDEHVIAIGDHYPKNHSIDNFSHTVAEEVMHAHDRLHGLCSHMMGARVEDIEQVVALAGNKSDDEARVIKSFSNFGEGSGYEHFSHGVHQREIFAKFAKTILLARHENQPDDPAYAQVPYLKKVMAHLDGLEEHYKAEQGREGVKRAEAYSAALAEKLDHERPGITRFQRSAAAGLVQR